MKRPRTRVARRLARILLGPEVPSHGAEYKPRLETIDDWILFGPRLR